MSSPGHHDGPSDNERPTWILELRSIESDDWAQSPVIFHGHVIEQRHPSGPSWATATIRPGRPDVGLRLTPSRVDLRVQPSDLPDDLTAAICPDTNHVVHMWCAGGLQPEAIEDFLEATRGVAADYALGREAWLEVLAHADDPDGGESTAPMFEDIFLGRYPNAAALRRLDNDPRWSPHADVLHSQTSSRLDVILQPHVNRIAEFR